MFYTNETVFRGHPDKVCDQISSAILDELIRTNPDGCRAGIECLGGKHVVTITGEVVSAVPFDAAAIAERVLDDCGYNSAIPIVNEIGQQSPDIALGVDKGGAGDNGVMFGFACDETDRYLPVAMLMLQDIAEAYDELRKVDSMFLPDGKAQLTGYYEDGYLKCVDKLVVCYQNLETDREFTDDVIRRLVERVAEKYGMQVNQILLNPTGAFRVGGFDADAGLTGRKICVDAYHSFAPVGGGCMNGKDPTKVDLTGAYMARRIAEWFVEAGAHRCSTQLAYAIGCCEPVSLTINVDGKEREPVAWMKRMADSRVMASYLEMYVPMYEKQARFGHFRSRGVFPR